MLHKAASTTAADSAAAGLAVLLNQRQQVLLKQVHALHDGQAMCHLGSVTG